MSSKKISYEARVYNITGPCLIVDGNFEYTGFPKESEEPPHHKMRFRDKLDLTFGLTALMVKLLAWVFK